MYEQPSFSRYSGNVYWSAEATPLCAVLHDSAPMFFGAGFWSEHIFLTLFSGSAGQIMHDLTVGLKTTCPVFVPVDLENRPQAIDLQAINP